MANYDVGNWSHDLSQVRWLQIVSDISFVSENYSICTNKAHLYKPVQPCIGGLSSGVCELVQACTDLYKPVQDIPGLLMLEDILSTSQSSIKQRQPVFEARC